MNRKGLSPVIATVLLVALALVLATIIYIWARAFIPEVIEKSGERIENYCPDVAFDISYSTDTNSLRVQNNGNVPIYGVEYGIERTGTLAYEDLIGQSPIVAGGYKIYQITDNKPNSGDTIRVIPILLGKSSSTSELKAFACDESAITIKV